MKVISFTPRVLHVLFDLHQSMAPTHCADISWNCSAGCATDIFRGLLCLLCRRFLRLLHWLLLRLFRRLFCRCLLRLLGSCRLPLQLCKRCLRSG